MPKPFRRDKEECRENVWPMQIPSCSVLNALSTICKISEIWVLFAVQPKAIWLRLLCSKTYCTQCLLSHKVAFFSSVFICVFCPSISDNVDSCKSWSLASSRSGVGINYQLSLWTLPMHRIRAAFQPNSLKIKGKSREKQRWRTGRKKKWKLKWLSSKHSAFVFKHVYVSKWEKTSNIKRHFSQTYHSGVSYGDSWNSCIVLLAAFT